MILSNINSIYKATEGEGIFIGRPQVFVRYQGCSIGCLNCDSKQTWEFKDNKLISSNDILKEITKQSQTIKWVSITGGDPLHPKNQDAVLDLLKVLKDKGYKVNIEAAGTVINSEIFNLCDFISWDIKTPSTGVKSNVSLLEKMLANYSNKLQIKTVVQDEADFLYLKDFYQTQEKTEFENWIITPAFCVDEKQITKRFELINNLNEEFGNHFRVIGQQHKWIYGPNVADV